MADLSKLCSLLALPMGIIIIVYYLLNWKKKTDVRGKVVVITGATSGLGRACAFVFFRAGCNVILCGRRAEELRKLKKELDESTAETKGQAAVVVFDMEQLNKIPEKANEILSIHGHVDILINNAGMSYRGQIEDTLLDVDQKLMTVNYLSHVVLTKAILPCMLTRRDGHIVAISSVQGKLSIPHRSAYSASKHAMQAFFDCLRAEVADRNVKVSVVSPGYIQTNLSNNAICADGSVYGVTDSTTAAGLLPNFVASQVLKTVTFYEKDIVLAPLTHRLAIYLKVLAPTLWCKIMVNRAKKQKPAIQN